MIIKGNKTDQGKLDESSFTAEETEKIFMKQKTRIT
jgi:hypothetical protein